jgi:hypothetical protein
VWSMLRCYKQDKSRVQLVVGQSVAGKNVSLEQRTLLGSVTRQLVKAKKTENT